jgi:prephenate dehydratase
MSDCKMNLTKFNPAKGRNAMEIFFFVDVDEKYADYVKTKALLEIMAEYFKVLGNIKNTKP